jgi:hypothetical protein
MGCLGRGHTFHTLVTFMLIASQTILEEKQMEEFTEKINFCPKYSAVPGKFLT